jgi:hypothetical protein
MTIARDKTQNKGLAKGKDIKKVTNTWQYYAGDGQLFTISSKTKSAKATHKHQETEYLFLVKFWFYLQF